MTDNNKSPETIFHPPSSVFTHFFFSADMLSVRLMPLFEWLPVPQRLFSGSWHKRQLVNWPQQLIYTLHKGRFWNLILFLEPNTALNGSLIEGLHLCWLQFTEVDGRWNGPDGLLLSQQQLCTNCVAAHSFRPQFQPWVKLFCLLSVHFTCVTEVSISPSEWLVGYILSHSEWLHSVWP